MLHWTARLRKPKTDTYTAVAVGVKLYYFGREPDGPDQLYVSVFNTVSLRWRTLPPVTTTTGERPPEVPCGRRGHTAVIIDDMVYIFGGRERYSRYHSLMQFDVRTHRWIKPRVYGTLPRAERGHSACVLGKVMYIYGGLSLRNEPTDDVYKLDTSTMVWSLINPRGPLPAASGGHSATIIGTKMFVFGGWTNWHLKNSIRVFDTETNSWLNTPDVDQSVFGRRWRHKAFANNGKLYLFAGVGGKNLYELWTFNPETFSWKRIVPKGNGPSLSMQRSSCCMVGDRVIISTAQEMSVLDLNPSLKTLCKLAVIQHGLEQSGLPHNIRWELAAMTKQTAEMSAPVEQ